MIFAFYAFPSNQQLVRLVVPDPSQLGEKLCKCNVTGLSAVVIDALAWSIERNPDKPAHYGNFSVRRLE